MGVSIIKAQSFNDAVNKTILSHLKKTISVLLRLDSKKTVKPQLDTFSSFLEYWQRYIKV